MARTITEIEGEMVVQKEATPELDGLTSNSLVSAWRLIFRICATGIKIVEDLFDRHVEIVDQAASAAISGTRAWYAAQTLLYQFGDELVYDEATGNFGYQVFDPDKQVAQLSAAQDDSTGAVFVKAAKIDSGTGAPIPLSVAELDGLTGYWEQKKFAGTNLSVLSDPGDKLQIEGRIVYDPNVLNSDGELLTDTSRQPAKEAIEKYLIDFGRENFSGIFNIMDMTDVVQATEGVFNAVPTTFVARKYDDSVVIDVLGDPDQRYTTIAGYMVLDPAFPTIITYIPQT
jgi:hypothetical protein